MRNAHMLPAILIPLLLGLAPVISEIGTQVRTTDSLELFSGERAITNNCQWAGFASVAYDKKDSKPCRPQDICTKAGLRTAIREVLRIRPGGFLWAGPECKSWVFIARRGTGRTKFHAAGDKKVKRVSNANTMILNLVALFCLAWVMDVLKISPLHGLLGSKTYCK